MNKFMHFTMGAAVGAAVASVVWKIRNRRWEEAKSRELSKAYMDAFRAQKDYIPSEDTIDENDVVSSKEEPSPSMAEEPNTPEDTKNKVSDNDTVAMTSYNKMYVADDELDEDELAEMAELVDEGDEDYDYEAEEYEAVIISSEEAGELPPGYTSQCWWYYMRSGTFVDEDNNELFVPDVEFAFGNTDIADTIRDGYDANEVLFVVNYRTKHVYEIHCIDTKFVRG